jgi:hypothetical protein
MRRTPQIRWGPTDGERISYLRDNYPSMTLREVTAGFNSRFGERVSEAAVGFQLNAHRILKVAARV